MDEEDRMGEEKEKKRKNGDDPRLRKYKARARGRWL
jgi:hypothetical protein